MTGRAERTIRVEDDFRLDEFLEAEAVHVESALERALDPTPELLPGDVAAAVAHGVLSGGKRLRPILLAAAYRACGGSAPVDAIYDLGASVELIHAYSLMHDDLPCMDDAELRRGRPTTHRMHGEAVTMRGGVAMIPLAALHARESARRLGRSEAEATAIAMDLLGAAGAGGMVGGQGLDLLGEGRALDAAELDRLHRHKTGALLTAALTMGAAAAGAGPRVRAAMQEYGEAVGLAFQVADDILDATATAEELGKRPSDAELDKSTYVSLFGLDEARKRGRALVDTAREALRAADVRSRPLEALAEYIMDRRK